MRDTTEPTSQLPKSDRPRLRHRFLIDHPTHGWQKFPLNRALLAYQGGDFRLPDLANQTIRVASATVVVPSQGQPASLLSLSFAQWHMDRDGRVDQEALMAGIVNKLDQALGAKPDDMPARVVEANDADLQAIRLALGMLPSAIINGRP